MATGSDISVTYTLSQPIDVPGTLEMLGPFGTETLPVNESRIIVIFQNAILYIESTEGPLVQTARLEINVFELPPVSHQDDSDAAARALIDDCLERLATTADVSATVASTCGFPSSE